MTTSCAGANTAQAAHHGFLPSGLADASAYNFQSLIDGGSDGSGDSLALVEFSNYTKSAVATYQTCFGTSVPVTNYNVSGGTTDLSGDAEVALDEEIAATAAPGLDHIYTYIAPNGAGFSTVLDRIVSDASTLGTNEISISWDLCEPFMDPSDLAASDSEFQLAAAAGISSFAAAGDDGSFGCHGYTGLHVDYPASDPYVTAVGGTTLRTSPSRSEVTWGQPDTGSGGAGGGGVSEVFPMPSWQTGTAVTSNPAYCGQTTRMCRELPDVSLDANPNTGYVVNVKGSWVQYGGTSASSPLLAAMTADANSYSLAHGGDRLGFASLFFYAHPGIMHDITSGTNNLGAGANYTAGPGFDLASGLGSPNGSDFATTLAASSSGSLSFDRTKLTAVESKGSVSATANVSLHGTLTNLDHPATVGRRVIMVYGLYKYQSKSYYVEYWVVTGTSGNWSVPVGTAAVKARMQWYASFPGEQGIEPAISAVQTLRVLPVLTTASSAHWNGLAYTASVKKTFTISGVAKPIMAGSTLTLQVKPSGGTVWHATAHKVKIAKNGKYSVALTFTSKVKQSYRWSYKGSTTGQWVSAVSPGRIFNVS